MPLRLSKCAGWCLWVLLVVLIGPESALLGLFAPVGKIWLAFRVWLFHRCFSKHITRLSLRCFAKGNRIDHRMQIGVEPVQISTIATPPPPPCPLSS